MNDLPIRSLATQAQLALLGHQTLWINGSAYKAELSTQAANVNNPPVRIDNSGFNFDVTFNIDEGAAAQSLA